MTKTLAVTWRFPESYWLPLWEAYYTPQVDEVQMWHSDEDLTALEQGRVFTKRINESLPDLLEEFDAVIIASNDEFIIPDPDKYQGLREYIGAHPQAVCRTTGFNVVTLEGDPPLDISRKITDQRSHWYYDKWYSKPSITRTPVHYISGWHFCNKKVKPDPDLILMHLREANLEVLMRYCPERLPARKRKFDFDYEERIKQAVPIPEKWRVI